MPFKLAALCASLLLVPMSMAAAAAPKVTAQQITGNWTCGPSVMKTADFNVTVSHVVERMPDMTFATRTTTKVEPKGQPAFDYDTASQGRWKLEGATLITTTTESTFLRSSTPQVTVAMGQKEEDEGLRKKSVYKSRVVHVDAKSMSTMTLEPPRPEAAVLSRCQRTPL